MVTFFTAIIFHLHFFKVFCRKSFLSQNFIADVRVTNEQVGEM